MKLFLVLTISLVLLSCQQQPNQEASSSIQETQEASAKMDKVSEEFQELAIDDLNLQLANHKGELTAKEVMRMYYPAQVESDEGNETITLTEEKRDNGNVVVTLIHDNLLDDSVKGYQYVMDLRQNDTTWAILSLKKNWKCREGRGHTNWGIELCH